MRKSSRTTIAIGIVVIWLSGLGWLAFREHNKPFSAKLAEGVRQLAPVTYYYIAEIDSAQIGAASSAIDTLGPRIIKADFIKTAFGTLRTTASLTRGFVLHSFRVETDTIDKNTKVPSNTNALLPSLAPIAFMLTGSHETGRSQPFQLFEASSGRIDSVTLSIRAESLFTVVDSAKYDSVATKWIPAHSDTVRAWKLETPNNDIAAWVDEQGRVVESTTKSGLCFKRTAYELAFRNIEKDSMSTFKQRR